MTDALAIAIAQVNPTVGDVDGNGARIAALRREAPACDLIVAGELALSGYPPEDLVLKDAFQARVASVAEALARETADGGPALLLGAPWTEDGAVHNAALLLSQGRIAGVRFKHDLPNYGVFDEKRVFAAGPLPAPLAFRGVNLGVMICEDMWTPPVARHLAGAGADVLIALNGSPFEADKVRTRQRLASARSDEAALPLIYVNLVGGQDELVFDGASFAVNTGGRLAVRAPAWAEGITGCRLLRTNGAGWTAAGGTLAAAATGLEAIYMAMCVGLADYVNKNGFPGVVIGLSGGIDSALTAAVAVDSLGAARVHCVMMPSPYTSPESLEDAAEVARLLGVSLDQVSIEPAMAAFRDMLAPLFAGRAPDITEENIQARCRGLVLMAISNTFGRMVLTTGNKSEMSVGYSTLYGDMCGGFSVLKDIYKTTVFALARWRNQQRPPTARGPAGRVMPERVIVKPPTAELRPNQTDQDSLPPYDLLDRVLALLIEDEASLDEVTARGFDAAMVRRVWQMLDRAEYKRRQAPPGVKITPRAFGRDRRYPITNGFTRLV
ncbi:MAG: NAD+ synthase [Rhodospirillales bacterium]|nr:NAD+ synthase [Rhodospirillales bacterium]